MINYWTARSDPSFAEWQAVFPPPTDFTDLNVLLRLAKRILEAGEQEAVYRVVEIGSPINFCAAPGWTYAQHLEKTLAQMGSLPLFDLGSGVAPTPSGQLRTPARLCYYSATGNLTEEEVEDMGLLLEHLRPDDVEWGKGYMARVAPVTLLSQTATITGQKEASARPRPIRIAISLLTDIWFPSVLGLLQDEQPPAPNPRRWYDNREIASCHTLRLNRFISSVRKLVLELGGEWSLVPAEGSAQHYTAMVREDGIVLET
jgi:hypothetical protein